jgi:hypothetical protein
MFNTGSLIRIRRVPLLMLVLLVAMLSGCKSKQEQALNQAKQQATATGQPQQVVFVDKNGATTTMIVQPPVKGQTNQAITTTTTPPAPGAPTPAPSKPAVTPVPQPPPAPVSVNVPAGTTLAIRLNQSISVKTNQAGDRFTGGIVDSVFSSDHRVLIPKGARVDGVVDASHRRGRFKGSSLLQLRLTSLTMNGTRYSLATRDLTRSKKGKGKRSAAMIGGGAGLGMLVGGVASGGTGLLVGGLAGGGAGTAAAGLTGNRDIEIPAGSIVRFKLAKSLVVKPKQ